ncbi:MAG: shikimate dehydrogenase [Clostridia bacterium]|nr:shikimate dehydrogenase [Clostridia bacterium]
MEYGLIGEHLPHSFSKEIHGRCADYDYQLTELTPEEVPAFMEAKAFKAINVTIPYKQTVIPYLTEIDEAALGIGAVNTVVNRDGKLYGYNTDFYGMVSLIRRIGVSLEGKKVLILGTGGTSHTAQAVAKAANAAAVITAGREVDHPDVTFALAYEKHTDADVIINTTPCGMYPYADGTPDRAGTPIDLSRFPNLCGVVDVVYNPLRTNLVLDAKERGLPAEGGLYMLVAQAVKACRIFLGQGTAGMDELTDRIYGQIAAEKENIVLTGMPGSGKSTVGKALAQAMNRPFIDTDEEIVKAAGKAIPEIFAEVGEIGFRELEAQVVRDVANRSTGCVIATGGGAILREENVRALRRTGRLYFLNRSLEALLPTEDRPLASTAEAIRKRYEERYDRYLATCDKEIVTDEVVEHTVQTIRKDFLS